MTELLAYHGDKAIKEKYLERVRLHRKLDHLVQGKGWESNGTTKGCAVGCTMEAYDHARYPVEIGVPIEIAYLEDSIFEGLPQEDAMKWPTQFLSAIEPGADLSLVFPRFVLWLLDGEDSPQKEGRNHETVRAAIDLVAELYRQWIATGKCPVDSAARSAAESAAESAESAESAAEWARSARLARLARLAAWSALSEAWKQMRDKLLSLLKAA